MKKKSTLLVVLLSLVCLVCAAIGFTACDPDDKDTVIKVGKTNIGTVTTDGSTYSVKGEVDTVYKLTAEVDGVASNDVLITVGDTQGTGFVLFTYEANCKATFTAVSENVKKVTVNLEKYVEPVIPGYETYTLTTTPLTVTDLKAGDEFYVSVAVQAGQTYTITLSSDDVKFAGRDGNESGPKSYDGSDYIYNDDDLDDGIYAKLVAEKDVASLTITLSVAPTVPSVTPDYDPIALGTEVTVSEFNKDGQVHYSLIVNSDTVYTVTTNTYISFECNGELAAMVDAADAIAEGEESFTSLVALTGSLAGTTYVVTVYNDQNPAKVTITANTTLSVANPIFADINGTATVYVIVDADKNYTVTTNNENVQFMVGWDSQSSLELIGADYVDYNGIASIRLTAESAVTDVEITLTVSEGGSPVVPVEYEEIVLGTSYDGDETIYKLVVSADGNYTFTASTSLWDLVVGVGISSGAVEPSVSFTPDGDGNYGTTETVQLTAGTYYVMGYDGTFTVSN